LILQLDAEIEDFLFAKDRMQDEQIREDYFSTLEGTRIASTAFVLKILGIQNDRPMYRST